MSFHCKDVDDLLRGCDDPAAAFSEKLESAVQVKSDAVADKNVGSVDLSPDNCKISSIQILGELPTGALVMYSVPYRRIYIYQPPDITIERAIQIGGEEVFHRVSRKITPGKIPYDHLKHLWIIEASQHQLPDAQFLGQGIHLVHDGRLLIVNGGFAYLWDGNEFVLQSKPILDDWLLDLQSGRQWIDFEELAGAIRAMTPSRAEQIKNRLVSLFFQWKFKGALDHFLMAGFVLAQILQAQWEWRPHLWISGSAGSGKSILIRLMKTMGGKLSLSLEGGVLSEPGLRQSIKSDSSLVTIDELESSPARDAIIQLLRSAGRGGTGARGSVNQQAIKTEIRHSVAVASIEVGIHRAAEASRFLCVSTVKLKDIKKPRIPDGEDLHSLRIDLFAAAIWASTRAKTLIRQMDSIKGYDQRFVESLAVPFSMLAACSAAPPEKELSILLHDYLKEWKEQAGALEDDETILRDQIFLARIRVYLTTTDERTGYNESRYADRSVGQILEFLTPEGHQTLQAYGIKKHLIKGTRKEGLFLHPTKVRQLLKDTVWRDLNIADILLRLPGAYKDRATLAGTQVRGVIIPLPEDEGREMSDGGVL